MGIPGIQLNDGSVVTVDEGEHLVIVDPSGPVRVIDDGHRYALEEHGDGTVSIRSDDGEEVETRGSSVSFTDAGGKRVVVDAASGDMPDGQAAAAASGPSAGGAAASGTSASGAAASKSGAGGATSNGASASGAAASGSSAGDDTARGNNETELSGDGETAKQEQGVPYAASAVGVVVVAVVVIVAVAGLVFWRRRKR